MMSPTAALKNGYQTLLSAAMRSGQPGHALNLFRAIVHDKGVYYDDAIRLIQLISSAGASRGDASASRQRSGLPDRCGILVYQPWFNFHWIELLQSALADGWFTPVFSGVRLSGKRQLPDLTSQNFREFRYKGRSLWHLCQYTLALKLRELPGSIAGSNAEQLEVVVKTYTDAAEMIDEAEDFIRAYQPESVLLAQGYHLIAAVMRDAAIRAGVRVVSVENTFRRDQLLWEDVCGIAVNTTLAKNYFWRWTDIVEDGVANESVERYLSSIHSHKCSEHDSPPVMDLPGFAPGPVVVYLGQVGTDASVLFGRRRFRSQVEAMKTAARAADAAGGSVVIKLHPKECATFRTDETFYRELTKGWLDRDEEFSTLRKRMGDRLIVDAENRFSTFELIRRADACVTINSQSGLEALILGKEVILCGHAYYGGLGFTHEAADPLQLGSLVERVLRGDMRLNDGITCRRFFHVFTELYCIPKTPEAFLSLLKGAPKFEPRPSARSVERSERTTAKAA